MSHIQSSTLVPVGLLEAQDAGCFLRSLYPDLPADAPVGRIDFGQYGAALIYHDEGREPVAASLIGRLASIPDHNRIVAHLEDGGLYLAVARDSDLLLVNSYPAPDFTTAEYYIFLVMKTLQLNPEQSCIRFTTALTEEQEMSLGRYFKAVEVL